MQRLPTREQLLNPILKAISELGGSGSVEEINEKVIQLMNIPESLVSIPHDSKNRMVEHHLNIILLGQGLCLRGMATLKILLGVYGH